MSIVSHAEQFFYLFAYLFIYLLLFKVHYTILLLQ